MKGNNKTIGIGKEIKEGGFREAFDTLPFKIRNEAKNEICKLCYWNNNIFKSKLSGRIAFRIYEIERIESFFKAYNINAWTGEKLTA